MKRLSLPSIRALLLGAGLCGLSALSSGRVRAADAPDDSALLAAFENGTLSQGEQSLQAALAGHADASEPTALRQRYALGITQFLRAAEKLGQSWRHYGLKSDGLASGLPFLRLPVGRTDPADAAPISYEEFRAVFVTFLADIQTAEKTLAALPEDPGVVPLRPGLVRIDYVGDGQPANTENLWRTYQRLNRAALVSEEAAGKYLIRFDAGDVPWFRGYCHILSALAETVLAYDESRLFDHTAHLFFEHPRTRFPFLLAGKNDKVSAFELDSITDLIAFIHLWNFPVREPARLTAALAHLQQMPALSRESWRRILAETDDDREWVPNPKQTGVLPGVKVTQEKIDAWLKTLTEADAILAGKKLLLFWRGQATDRQGINLRRVFTEPTDFDLVLWIQGTGVAPYLEAGTSTDPKLWREINGAFGGNALGFALYFN